MKLRPMRLRTLLILMVPIALFLTVATRARWARTMANQAQCHSNLAFLNIQLSNYRLNHGRYPPAVFPGRRSATPHSWRAIVHAESHVDDFAAVYNLFQPWNSPGNRKAADDTPRVFGCRNNHTHGSRAANYVAVIDGDVSTLDLAAAIPPGAPEEARQVLLVEYPNSDIAWTEPRDLDVTELSRLGPGSDPGGIGVLFADGSFRRLRREDIPVLFGR